MSDIYKWATLDNSDAITLAEKEEAINISGTGTSVSVVKSDTFNKHINNTIAHITQEERERWNNSDVLRRSEALIIWNLNDFFNTHLNVEWVRNTIINSSAVYIPRLTELYGEDATRNSWIEDTLANNNVPRVELLFKINSYLTFEIIRRMFRQMDYEIGYSWLAEGSYSKRYIKPGLTVGVQSILSSDVLSFDDDLLDREEPSLSFVDSPEAIPSIHAPSFILLTWNGPNKWSDKRGYSQFNPTSPDIGIGESPVISDSGWDSFTGPYCWTYSSNEQQTTMIERHIYEHVIDEDIHMSEEKLQNIVWNEESYVMPEEFETVWDKISPGSTYGNFGGFRFILDEDISLDKMEIYGIERIAGDDAKASYIKIWAQPSEYAGTKNGATLVAVSGEMTTLGPSNPEVWSFSNTVSLTANTRYVVTFNENTLPIFDTGYTVRFTGMAQWSEDQGFKVISGGDVSEFGNYCPRFTFKVKTKEEKVFTTIPQLEARIAELERLLNEHLN